jgi:hypothetical protein
VVDRVLRATASTISVTFHVDGTATDPTPDTATVHITRADGTDVVVAGTAATSGGAGVFSFTLTPLMTAVLDTLTVRWTTQNLGTLTTTVEVVGGFLFSVAQARALKPLNDTTRYPTQAIIDARTLAESALEDACDVAFVPRARTVTTIASGSTLSLGVNRVRSVGSITDYEGTVTDLTTTWIAGGMVVGTTVWSARPLTVRVEHGYDTPPPRVSAACLLLAKNWLIKGPIDDRATAVTTDDGTFSMATPGLRGSSFGLPEVDAVVAEYRESAYVA